MLRPYMETRNLFNSYCTLDGWELSTEKTIIEIIDIITALVIDAKIIANVTSDADNGAPIISTIFPITFPINNDEDECEKDCWITCIAIKPGAKNTINSTPKTLGLVSPTAREITNKKSIDVTIGPIIVWPKTDKNLKVSLIYSV